MQLLLVRHGAIDDHAAGRYVGSLDRPLSVIGRRQAKRLASLLPGEIDRCLCSPMRRARQTADLALAEHVCPLDTLDSLREIDFGRWEGLTFAEIAAQDPELVDEWQRDALAFHFPGGEQTGHFWQRVDQALQVIATISAERVLVISHGGVIRAMLCSLLGLPFDKYLAFAVQPAALTVLDVQGRRGVLQALNLV